MFKKGEELKEAGLAAAEFDLDVSIEDIDAISNLLTLRHDENGQKWFFSRWITKLSKFKLYSTIFTKKVTLSEQNWGQRTALCLVPRPWGGHRV